MSDAANGRPVIYIDRSEVHPDRMDELKAGVQALVAFVEERQPQMVAYAFYLDERAGRMTVVSVHPNSASLERHLDVGANEFKKLAPMIHLREIEVFGELSDRATALLDQKTAALGDRGTVTIHRQFSGFDRIAARHEQ